MTTGSPDQLVTSFVGRRARLFRLVLVTSLLTLLTLGFYRFWARSRIRRWYWSAIRPGGQPLEYVGQGSEKFAGFCLAVTILAFWLGLVNLILMFASLTLFAAPFVAYALSFLGLIPIWFFARYRARGYLLARTRWRGIRFGLAKGAWGYAIRALWHWLVTILTLGALWPRMTFKLEEFKTNRTFFGDHRFHQGGDWTMLWPAFAHVFVASLLSVCALLISIFQTERFAWILIVLVPWALYGLIHYQVRARVLLTNSKNLSTLRFNLMADPRTIARITGFGATAILALLLLIILFASLVVSLVDPSILSAGIVPTDLSTAIALAVFLVIIYFCVFLLYGTLRHSLITMPIWRHYSETLALQNPDALHDIRQKDRAERADADGFAEALDLGAAV